MMHITTFRLVPACALAMMAGAALAQTPIGRMPGDVPYAHEYGANRPFQPSVVPPPAPPVITPVRPPEQSLGYQPVRPRRNRSFASPSDTPFRRSGSPPAAALAD